MMTVFRIVRVIDSINERPELRSEQLRFFTLEQLQRRLVDRFNRPLIVDRDDAFRRRVEDRTKPGFLIRQC